MDKWSKDFRGGLSDEEKIVWDALNYGLSQHELLQDLGIRRKYFRRVWDRIVAKGKEYFREELDNGGH